MKLQSATSTTATCQVQEMTLCGMNSANTTFTPAKMSSEFSNKKMVVFSAMGDSNKSVANIHAFVRNAMK